MRSIPLFQCVSALQLGGRRPGLARQSLCARRSYAGVHDACPPPPPTRRDRTALDRFILSRLTVNARHESTPSSTRPECSYRQYRQNANKVLPSVLPYEPYPPAFRRADHLDSPGVCRSSSADTSIGDGIVLVVHAAYPSEGGVEPDYTVCSGFVVEPELKGKADGPMVVTCSHTLEEIHHRHPAASIRTYIVLALPPPTSTATQHTEQSRPQRSTIPVDSIPTSLPRLDLLILRPNLPTSFGALRSLPVSPFPISSGQAVLVHFFGSPDPPEPRAVRGPGERVGGSALESWEDQETDAALSAIAWPTGGPEKLGWRRWVKGRMRGYRGDLWEEVEPGTADSLPYILTSPLPTPGSSGGPILDTASGAVIGVISGTRMDNRVEGERGWGASAENIFELFSLPGFVPASAKAAVEQ